MSELETAIRDALRSRSDTVEILASEPRRRRSRSFAPLLAAAVVAVLAVTTALILSGRSGNTGQGANGAAAYVGYRWRLVSVHDSVGTIPVAASLQGEIAFAPDGTVTGNDTVHALQGRYQRTGDGYTVTDPAFSGNGSVGLDSTRQRVITAMGDLFAGSAGTASVTARVDRDTLTLSAGGVAATFERAGVRPNDPAPSSTSNSSPNAILSREWQLVSITDGNGTLGVAASSSARLLFPSATSIEGSDGVNYLTGTMRLRAGGFIVLDYGSTLALAAPGDRVAAAIDAVFRAKRTAVATSVAGTALTLRVGATTLELTERPVGGPALPPASGTRTS